MPNALTKRHGHDIADTRGQSESDVADIAVALGFQFLARTRPTCVRMPRVCSSKLATGLREHHAAAVAIEQVLTEFHFEFRDLTAQGRLANRQKSGGMREAAEFGDVAKILELLEIQWTA